MKMSPAEKQELMTSLQKHGFSPEEIDGVFRGLQQIENGEGVPAEEVYRKLFSKMNHR